MQYLSHCSSSHPFPDTAQGLVPINLKWCEYSSSHCWLIFELFNGMLGVSDPALKFAVWLMMHSCSLTHDNVTQKGITFLMIPVQKKGTDAQMVMPLLFWNPPFK